MRKPGYKNETDLFGIKVLAKIFLMPDTGRMEIKTDQYLRRGCACKRVVYRLFIRTKKNFRTAVIETKPFKVKKITDALLKVYRCVSVKNLKENHIDQQQAQSHAGHCHRKGERTGNH